MVQTKSGLVFCLAFSTACFCGSLFAESGIPKFVPELKVNKDPAVCEPLLQSWRSVYASAEPLKMTRDQLISHFGTEEVHSVGGGTLLSIDLDADGKDELLFIQSSFIGWRYRGESFYLFRDEAHREKVLKYTLEKYTDLETLARKGYEHGAIPLAYGWEKQFLIKLGARVYKTSTSPEESNVRFYPLVKDPEANKAAVCEIQIEPETEKISQLEARVGFTGSLQPVFGGPGNCWHGTLGWGSGATRPGSLLPTLFYRPQTLADARPNVRYPARATNELRNTRTELRLISWGLSDPTSWSRYLQVQEEIPGFLSTLSQHYQTEFGVSEADAQQWAENAYYVVMDKLIYSANEDRFKVTHVSYYEQADFHLAPMPNLAEVARSATATWAAWVGEPNPESARYQHLVRESITVLTELILLNIYAGASIEEIASLWRVWDSKAATRRDRGNAQFLAASIQRPEVLDFFLDQGLSPDLSTNTFGKTTLMYAAQHDLLSATTRLLAAGADPNAKTKSDLCPKLSRDHRTALMYAAENGHQASLDQLIDHGADICSKDSTGNDLTFYANLNVVDSTVATWVTNQLKGCTTNAAE